jgi:hypothetical protein
MPDAGGEVWHILEVYMKRGADGSEPLISRAEMRERVEHAKTTERFLLRLGWLVLALGITSLVVTGVLLLHGDITMEQALATVFGVIISGILSGAAAYSSGTNIGLGASRLVLSLGPEEQEPEGHEGQD